MKGLRALLVVMVLIPLFAPTALAVDARIQRGTDTRVRACAALAANAYNIALHRDEGANIGDVKFVIRQEHMDSKTQDLMLMMVDGIYEDDWRLSPDEIRRKAVHNCLRGAGVK